MAIAADKGEDREKVKDVIALTIRRLQAGMNVISYIADPEKQEHLLQGTLTVIPCLRQLSLICSRFTNAGEVGKGFFLRELKRAAEHALKRRGLSLPSLIWSVLREERGLGIPTHPFGPSFVFFDSRIAM